MVRTGKVPAKAALLGAAFLFLATACSNIEPFGGSRRVATNWAVERGFSVAGIRAGTFDLIAFSRLPATPAATLTVYIEGDGAPWPTPYHPPRDPTPPKPVALALAAADPSAAVVYLGRPCQYLEADALARCPSTYWTDRRFAPEVLAAYDVALSKLLSAANARRIRLVGYSGGGTIATLLAATRSDIDALVTVAAPLAVEEWTDGHGVSPLTGSLDPMKNDVRLPGGVHFVGANDRTVSMAIAEHFVRAKGGRVIVVPEFDHECCWMRDWAALLQNSLAWEEK